MCTGNRTEGSNPSLSATPPLQGGAAVREGFGATLAASRLTFTSESLPLRCSCPNSQVLGSSAACAPAVFPRCRARPPGCARHGEDLALLALRRARRG